jgi:putative colanic acid biosynthesis UDP-glucose lipid carrier transferase
MRMLTDLERLMARDAQSRIVRRKLSLIAAIQTVTDPLLVAGSLFAITLAYGETFDAPDAVLALLAVSFVYPLALGSGAGRQRLWRVVWSWAFAVGVFLVLGLLTGYISHFRGDVLFTWALMAPALIYVSRLTLPVVAPRILSRQSARTAVLVGLSDVGRKLGEQFDSHPALGVRLLGLFDDRAAERLGKVPDWGLKGRLTDLPEFVKAHRIDTVFIALPMSSQVRLLKLLDELRDTTASIYFVPDIFLFDVIQARLDEVNGIPVLAVCETPHDEVNSLVKGVFDFIFASLILALIWPLLIAIAIGVKASSPGPVLFKQRRYGLDGRDITVYKFRTMRVMQDGAHVPQAKKDDPRVTPLGGILRRTSLDELPQFINVLQGRMSIVGPRPHAAAHNELYRKQIKGYMIRHKVKPGITGLAQVSGFRGETDSLEKMEKRIELDLAYLRSWSLGLDLMIILKTISVVLGRSENAY